MDSDELFDGLVADLAVRGVTAGNMFGTRALKAEKKAIGCLLKSRGDMAFRLGAGTPAHTEALGLDGAELFDPSGMNQPFKDWVVVPAAHSDRWLHFAEAGLDYLTGG